MCELLCERTGYPFTGKDQEKLRNFLAEQELEYDESITYSIVLEDGDKIAATGSCHGNVLKCIAVSPEYQGRNLLSLIMTRLIEHLYSQGIAHYLGFTKPKNKEIFCNMGLYPIAEIKDVILLENKQNGLKKYLKRIEEKTRKEMQVKRENKDGAHIGAVVANFNPFTLGHRYLMEEAAKQCRWLHVFILSEEQQFLTSRERFRLVPDYTEDRSVGGKGDVPCNRGGKNTHKEIIFTMGIFCAATLLLYRLEQCEAHQNTVCPVGIPLGTVRSTSKYGVPCGYTF